VADAKIVVSAQDNASGVLGKVQGSLGDIQGIASKVSGALGLIGIAGVGGLVAMGKAAIDGIDRLNDLKAATGSSIENLSGLEDVAARTGTSMDTVSTALVKFNGALKEAKPNSPTQLAIEALNLSVTDLKALDPAQALLKVATALSGYADDGNKARIVQELFGKSIKDVAKLLEDLAEKGELVAKVTTQEAIEANKFNNELATLEKNSLDGARAIAGPLVTALNSLIEKQRELKKEGKMGLFTSLKDMADAADRKRSANLTGDWSVGDGGRGKVNPPMVRPSLPDSIDKAVKEKKTGKSQAEKDAEWIANKTMELQRQVAMDAGDAVNKENQKIEDDRLQTERDVANERMRLQRLAAIEAGQAVIDANEAYAKGIEDAAKEKARLDKKFADDLSSDLKGAFSSAFRDTSGEPLKAFGDAIANVIYSRAATALAESLMNSAAGDATSTFFKSLLSFDGGGYTGSGSRSGGLDGKGGFLSVMHPNETVLDHTRGQQSTSAQPVTVIQNFTVGDVASVSMVRQAVAGSERRIAGAMGRSMQYGGALA